jgi:hypothetical protein
VLIEDASTAPCGHRQYRRLKSGVRRYDIVLAKSLPTIALKRLLRLLRLILGGRVYCSITVQVAYVPWVSVFDLRQRLKEALP